MSGEYNRSEVNGATSTTTPAPAANGSSAPGSPAATTTSAPASSSRGTDMPKAVEEVMYSDIGVMTLLNRLKQSIASARDFAAFLKKRSSLEEEQATGLKRLAKTQLDTLRRADVKGGSYAAQLAEVMRAHERMADHGMQFALSLHQMHEDLDVLAANMERGRKQWKHDGLDAEKRASDAEATMQKAKSRYDGLAEDYDRARTGDTKGSRRLGLKGPKSAEQYEQDLLRKTQSADVEYEDRVKQAKSLREALVRDGRPKAVKALKELVRECDSALALQLQKFATFNEKLLLGNGLAVTPLTDKDTAGAQRSLRDVIYEIDNDTDFNVYMRNHLGKIPARPSEIRYEQHPTLMPKTQKPNDLRNASTSFSGGAAGGFAGGVATGMQAPQLSVNTGAAGAGAGAGGSQPGSTGSRYGSGPQVPTPQQTSAQMSGSYGRPPSAGTGFQQQQLPPPPQQDRMQSPTYGGPQKQPPYSASQPPLRDTYNSSPNYNANSAPPYPTSELGASPYAPGQTTGSVSAPPHRQYTSGNLPSGNPMSPTSTNNSNNNQPQLPPPRPVFGISLDELFTRDGAAVPLIVIQCILAIDTFGLETEGIYRLSGTASHIQTLKSQFDHATPSTQPDFRNPANFFHDVNSVATLLKQFFRDLPDPLFTRYQYTAFIEAARIEDEGQRRDALHQGINDLPDPNYATLRALVLHLHRVMQNEARNRMGASNLALCFAPSLMGTHTGAQIADASLQARVLDTILVNAAAIFDED